MKMTLATHLAGSSPWSLWMGGYPEVGKCPQVCLSMIPGTTLIASSHSLKFGST